MVARDALRHLTSGRIVHLQRQFRYPNHDNYISIMMLDQLIKRALLHAAYFMFFLYNSLLYLTKNVEHLYHYLSNNNNKQLLLINPETSLRIPQHIAMTFTNESHQLDLKSVSKLICWCKQLGVKYITLFDDLGRIRMSQKELYSHLEDQMSQIGYEKPISYIKGLNILSRTDGRQKFIHDIKGLLKYEPEKIDIDLVQKQVGWTSDPEMLISFGNHFCLHGFPPWQLRLTEVFFIPTHKYITRNIFIDCLIRYTSTTQRLGA